MRENTKFGELRCFKDGELVMDYGKYIRMMQMVVQCTLKVLKKDDSVNEILLYYLFSSETCSMAYSCCLEEKKSEVKANAEGDLTIVAILHNKLDEWLCKYPSWKNYIMRSLNEHFSEMLKSI